MICPYCGSTLDATLKLVAPPPVSPPTPTPVTYTDDTLFRYTGAWSIGAGGAGKYQGSDHYSAATGASFDVDFTGTRIALVSSTAPHHGIASVSLDGAPAVDVDFYSAARVEQALVWTSPTLADGAHTLHVAVAGRKTAASTGFVVTADKVAITGTFTPPAAPPPPPPPGTLSALRVSGNRIVDAAGQTVMLRGVNRSGTEYMCVLVKDFFDGPSDQASIDAIRSWRHDRINVIRVPLNEDCWLAINGVPGAFAGSAYQQAIKDYVTLLNRNGLYVILELHWSAPGGNLAGSQNPMPDRDHSITFWSQVATAFKGNDAVILEPLNEPYPDNNQDTTIGWRCWRDGGTAPGVPYAAAGMQELVTAIRATGATNIIALSGLRYAGALSQWLAFKPTDPLNNLVCSWHVYPNGECADLACYNGFPASVATQVPVIATEIGNGNCDAAWMNTLLSWLEAHGVGYLAWTWDTWGTGCGSICLVSDYAGTPTQYGKIYRDHLAALP